jgi:ABC-type multidrug transport system fused ATPase/permease subunit
MSMFFTGLIIALVYDWKLTLVILSIAPLIAVSGALFSKLLILKSSKSQSLYSIAGGIVEESLTMFRTIVSYGTQGVEASRWVSSLTAVVRSCTQIRH